MLLLLEIGSNCPNGAFSALKAGPSEDGRKRRGSEEDGREIFFEIPGNDQLFDIGDVEFRGKYQKLSRIFTS